MFDAHWGGINLASLVLIVSIIIILPMQLLLCFKVKSRTIRLVPIGILSILTVALVIISFLMSAWDGIAYIIFAIFSGFMMLICGLAWGIWSIINALKKKNCKHQ